MPCSANVLAPRSPVERAHYVAEHLSPYLFRSVAGQAAPEAAQIAWRITPEPFPLAPATVAKLEVIGTDLLRFYRALNKLYYRSVKGTMPVFVREYLEMGKPEQIIRLQRQNRFKQDIPSIIRPDIILTERINDDGMIAAELDAVPGGMGFVGAMGQTYCELGYDQVGEHDGILQGFAGMARALTGKERPVIAIVVSSESEDYRGEMIWLAGALERAGLADAVAVKPEDLVFTEEALVVDTPNGRRTVDLLYRFFELFDLLNIPKQELIFYAARHKRVVVTPPAKSFFEEKLTFALLHHPMLETFWREEMGIESYERVGRLFPQTWILDPRPLPPQAVIDRLRADGRAVHQWSQLYTLSKSERHYVVKPSGFSELSWGSKGVYVGDDLTKDEWMAVLDGGLAMFDRTPHILQRFHKGRRVQVPYLDAKSGEVAVMDGRVRLCPYYFIIGDEAKLSGVLATIVPADKRLIHGMSTAIMAPCAVSEQGN